MRYVDISDKSFAKLARHSLGAGSLLIFVGPYLSLDRGPVHLDVPGVLLELLDVFFFCVLL